METLPHIGSEYTAIFPAPHQNRKELCLFRVHPNGFRPFQTTDSEPSGAQSLPALLPFHSPTSFLFTQDPWLSLASSWNLFLVLNHSLGMVLIPTKLFLPSQKLDCKWFSFLRNSTIPTYPINAANQRRYHPLHCSVESGRLKPQYREENLINPCPNLAFSAAI